MAAPDALSRSQPRRPADAHSALARPESSRSEQTRARLLEAAVAAFADRGFHGTTTRDIASAAGMSPAAVYVHHRSKEELLYQISRTGHLHTLAVLEAADDPAASAPTRLAALTRAFTKHHATNHTSARIVNYELAALSPAHRAEIGELRHDIDRMVRAVVESGVAAGEFDTPNPRMAAAAVLSMGVDIARWYRDDGALNPDEIADFYADLALRLVGAH